MNRERLPLSSLIIVFLLFQVFCRAQPWKGVIASSRAIDWSQSGIPGGLPDRNWAQCGSTIAPYGTSGSPGSTSTINKQIAGCSANTYVQLGAGTFYLIGTIMLKNQTVIRGMGADSTFILFYGEGSCGGLYSQFCEAGSINYVGGEQNNARWTAGFSRGATSITLSNSLNITAGRTWVILDQQDEAADTGNIWNCLGVPCGGFSGGFARKDDTCSLLVSPNVGYCSQLESTYRASGNPYFGCRYDLDDQSPCRREGVNPTDSVGRENREESFRSCEVSPGIVAERVEESENPSAGTDIELEVPQSPTFLGGKTSTGATR